MLYRLVILTGPQARRQITIDKAPMLIGSGEECAIRLQDEEVFDRHASIEHTDQGLWIRAVGSMGSFLVNRHEVRESHLKHGDEIEIGRTRFIVQAKVRAEVEGDASSPVDRRRKPALAISILALVLAAGAAAFLYTRSRPESPVPPAADSPAESPAPTVASEFPVPEPDDLPTNAEPAAAIAGVPVRPAGVTSSVAPAAADGDIQKMRDDLNGIRQMMQSLVEKDRSAPRPPSPPARVTTGLIRIVSVEASKFPATESYREIRTLTITLQRNSATDLGDRSVRADVTFFDKNPATGAIAPSRARVRRDPAEIRGEWIPDEPKTVTATYTVPAGPGASQADPAFYGYIVRAYCAGVLQDEKARPADLLGRGPK